MPTIIHQLNDHRPATEHDAQQLEMALAAVLPDDYRNFLLCYNGGYPEPCCFLDGTEVVNSFFGFCQKHDCLWCHYYACRNVLPDWVIPIADDPGGNYVCLAVYKPDCGKVYFWDHESNNLILLAESFTNFLDSLCDPDGYESPKFTRSTISAVQQLLDSFDAFPQADKHRVTVEILRRVLPTSGSDLPESMVDEAVRRWLGL